MTLKLKSDRAAAAFKKIYEAEKAYHALIPELYPPGCNVRWDMGGHTQTGMIISTSHEDMIVRNDHTGVEYRVAVSKIFDAEGSKWL